MWLLEEGNHRFQLWPHDQLIIKMRFVISLSIFSSLIMCVFNYFILLFITFFTNRWRLTLQLCLWVAEDSVRL